MRIIRLLLLFAIVFSATAALAQDVNLYLTDHYLPGVPIIKVNRDFDDEYMWVLTQNNGVYRLNTLTKKLDDFTSQFQSFNNYHFFDIAAFGENTVSLAAKGIDSTILITYDKGIITFPLQQDFFGYVKGAVTSIGASSFTTEALYGSAATPAMLIATEHGFYRLNFLFSPPVFSWNGDVTPSQIYTTTYRNQMMTTRDRLDTTSGVNLIPALAAFLGGGYEYDGLIRHGGTFGDTTLTAYFTINALPGSQPYYSPDVFWGNQSGMFQAKFRNEHPFLSSTRHYLKNIKINKIIDIFGLTPFGNSVAKENLLVGTDNGLYYSSSFLHAGRDTSLDNFTLYHYDVLGNIPINFVEVNATNDQIPVCENGIWVATNNGFYLIRPDFIGNLNTSAKVNAVHFDDAIGDTTSKHICAGDSISVLVNTDISNNPLQWFKDSAPLNNASGSSLAIKTTGDYYVVIYDPCSGLHLESNHLKVTTISSPVFSFNYPDTIKQCSSAPYTLKTDINPGYHYRWYTNGVFNGNTTPSYTVTQTGKYKVEVSACTNSWVPSKEVEVDLVTLPVPQVTRIKRFTVPRILPC